MPEQRDYRDTVFLPKTDFPMKAGLAKKEPGILARWQEDGVYERLRDVRKGREKFLLHDGPPYANGNIHIGHSLNKILKDLVVRTQSLLGKDAPYVPGWDCHGLPIEWKIEEQYRKKKRNKDEVPPAEFRAECRAYADNWVNVQREEFKRLGVMGEWDKPYLTMDFDAEAVIVEEFLKFAESQQVYRGAKPVMWSPVEKTALAEAEVEYQDITSTQIDVAFEITEAPNAPGLVGKYVAVWTTTPWTIPVNQALSFSNEADYVVLNCVNVPGGNIDIIVARDLVGDFCRRTGIPQPVVYGGDYDLGADGYEDGDFSAIAEPTHAYLNTGDFDKDGDGYSFKGAALEGATARHPIYEFLRRSRVREDDGNGLSDEAWERALEFYAKPRPFLPGDFVTTEAGTGLVHMAPDHGEDDFALCREHGIDPVFAVEDDGRYREDWAWLAQTGSVINKKFNAPDGPICSDLREAGALLSASDDFQHSYPHSWRSKAKVIFRCTPQWFVRMDQPIESGPQKPVSAEPVEARLSADNGPSTSSGPTDQDRGHARGIPATLRELALAEIDATRFIPERGHKRLRSMVEGRPDWVLSRQRAWGVPITLYVDKQGNYLNDPEVNARIVEAVREGGADAWFAADHQALLGNEYQLDDYEVVTDILDVWFDSGSTHAFVLESGKWDDLETPATLYLEGSDQHRGWFQSSLLESCGTRGHAPYKELLTHGMTLDKDGKKMSKSLGNTMDPQKIIDVNGADILRLWASTVDFTEDHRISPEILKGVTDTYRKLRNTFRYMLGALGDFSEEERVPVAEMPELERYVLHLLAGLDATLRDAVNDYAFSRYARALADFANEDLSAFFFDIRKDVLYCDVGESLPEGSATRRAYRTVLDTLFHALARYAAPVLVFTAEEVWRTRFGDEAESVHLAEWPDFAELLRHSRESGKPEPQAEASAALDPRVRGDDAGWMVDEELAEKWQAVRTIREQVTERIEPLRRDKEIGSSLEAEVWTPETVEGVDLAEIFISSTVHQGDWDVKKTELNKCGRCWRFLPDVEEEGALCGRCAEVTGL